MCLLAEREKKMLLRVARTALVAAVERQPIPELPAGPLLSLAGGAFVTIHRRGRLRGCIGHLPSDLSLTEVVAFSARAVASEDPRFPRVQPEELPAIEIELSVLSPLADIKPSQIEPGKHGLFVSNGPFRGILLPQVAVQSRWDGIRFLEATCEKAGLARSAWKECTTRVQAFMTEIFNESELGIAEVPAERRS
jgi:uncharacterized protein